jgi:hypothetical protein
VEDTLKAPGSVRLVADYTSFSVHKRCFSLYPYYKSDPTDNRNNQAFYYSDSNGLVVFNNLAEGLYTLTVTIKPLLSDGKHDIYLKKTMIVVMSGELTDLDTLRFSDAVIPLPQNFNIGYDSLTGSIKFSWHWNDSDTASVSGINFYQFVPPSLIPVKVNATPVTDTFFIDKEFWNLPRRPEIFDYKAWDTIGYTLDTIGYDNNSNPVVDSIPMMDSIPMQGVGPSYFVYSVDKAGNECTWRLVNAGLCMAWKTEDGIPGLPDTLTKP